MPNTLPHIARIAEQLGGDAHGEYVLAPGPGHSADDRSLSIKLDPNDRDGFRVHSFAGDPWQDCRDHVKKLIGLPDHPQKPLNGGGAPWTTLRTHIYRDADNKPRLRVEKKLDDKGKRRYVQSHWTGDGWVKGRPEGPKIPYRLPEPLADPTTATIYHCEGERDVDALSKIGFVATTMSEGSSAEWDSNLTPYFKDRLVVILPDADFPGRKYAQMVARAIHGVAAEVRVVDLYPERHDGSDASDWLAKDTAGVELAKLVKETDAWEPSAAEPDEDESASPVEIEITRLAKLTAIKFEQERKAAAEALGFRASMLDRLVEAERSRLGLDGGGDDAGLQGRAISFPEPEPWPQPVDGAALFDEIAAMLKRYVVMDEQARYSTALWVVHSYLLDCFMISPRLAVRSPMKRCGKTTLLDVLGCLVLKALPTANVSAAAVFRVIEGYRPCLLVDEADTFLAESDELRGVLNSGHRRGGSVLRTVGDDHEPRAFATYSAVAIGIIGALPDTLADRSIPVDFKRKLSSEKTESFRIDRVGHLEVLARKVARWADDNATRIAAADPEMPPSVHSRAADNWRSLVAIADAAGGEWPERVRAVATHSAAESETESLTELLLGDIREAFAKRDTDRLSSVDLVAALVGIEGRPWAELGKSRKPLTPNRLARLLKPLAIAPDSVRIEEKTPKGYYFSQFKEAFARYLSSEGAFEPQHRNNPYGMRTSDLFQSATAETDVADRKCEKSASDGACCGVADEKGGSSDESVFCAHCGLPGGNEVFFGGEPMVRLHRECEEPYQRLNQEAER